MAASPTPSPAGRAVEFRPGRDSAGLRGGREGKGAQALLTRWSPWWALTAVWMRLVADPLSSSRTRPLASPASTHRWAGAFAGSPSLNTLSPAFSRTQRALSLPVTFLLSVWFGVFWGGGILCRKTVLSTKIGRHTSGDSRRCDPWHRRDLEEASPRGVLQDH